MFSSTFSPPCQESSIVPQHADADRAQQAMVREAVGALLLEFERNTGSLGAALRSWTARLADHAEPAVLFTAPFRFPMLQLPWWVEVSCRKLVDQDFQRDLIRSSVAGYWFIRLTDGVMDSHLARPALAAAAGSLYHEFEAPYHRRFGPEHPFWHHFRQSWSEAASAAFLDAESSATVDDARFLAVAARKSAACKIPAAAALWQAGRPERLADWMAVCDLLGAHEQMLDDITDWQRDRDAGRATRLLSEARRHSTGPGGEVAWIVSEGIDWAFARMAVWRTQLAHLAHHLESPDLLAFLHRRTALIADWSAQWRPALAALAGVAREFEDATFRSLRTEVPSPVPENVP
jgi:hypothetical protein